MMTHSVYHVMSAINPVFEVTALIRVLIRKWPDKNAMF